MYFDTEVFRLLVCNPPKKLVCVYRYIWPMETTFAVCVLVRSYQIMCIKI